MYVCQQSFDTDELLHKLNTIQPHGCICGCKRESGILRNSNEDRMWLCVGMSKKLGEQQPMQKDGFYSDTPYPTAAGDRCHIEVLVRWASAIY